MQKLLEKETPIDYANKDNLEDMLLSIIHRVSILEKNLHSKMDRSQCLAVCENKVTHLQLNGALEGIKTEVYKEFSDISERQTKIKQQNEEMFKNMARKLNGSKKQIAKQRKKYNSSKLIQPQQLYVQGNETMFSLVIDEITSLQKSSQNLQKQLLKKNKSNIVLHNQICSKIQALEEQITSLSYNKQRIKQSRIQFEEKEKPTKKYISNKNQHHYLSNKTINKMNQSFLPINQHVDSSIPHVSISQNEGPNFQHLTNLIEGIQKQLATKLNIKDIVPIIKNNLESLEEKLKGVRNYTKQGIESTKKILVQQSEINQQICSVIKLGYWSSFGEASLEGFSKWDREINNMVPQLYIFSENTDAITIIQPGHYLIQVHTMITQRQPEYIVVNQDQIPVDYGEVWLKISEPNSVIRVPGVDSQLLLKIHKV